MRKTLVNLKCPRCGETQENAWHSRKVCAPCRWAQEKAVSRSANGKAWTAVAKAIRAGELTPQPCERCGTEKTQAHHDDYAKPLDVRWLCLPCHRQHHLKFGPGKNSYAEQNP